MRNNNILTTNKIEVHIKEEISKSVYIELLNEKLGQQYFFTNNFNVPGEYIFSDNNGYHKVGIGDRGKKYPDEKPLDLECLCYSVYWELATSISYSSACAGTGDWRRGAFSKTLKILSSIDENYVIRGQMEIDEILRSNPYNDNLEK